MLTRDQIQFLLQALTSRNTQGTPIISVNIEGARVAADTFDELTRQLNALPPDNAA